MSQKVKEVTRYDAFLKMHSVISTLIPGDPPRHALRNLTNNELLGYGGALDAFLEDVDREWVRRGMKKEAA